MTSVVYNRYLRSVTKKIRMMFGIGHHTTLIVNNLFKTSIFPIIGKKNNQSSVSYADEKSQPSGQQIMYYPVTLGLEFSGLHRRPMIDSICPVKYIFLFSFLFFFAIAFWSYKTRNIFLHAINASTFSHTCMYHFCLTTIG